MATSKKPGEMPAEHIVVSGETFSKIAARYGLTVKELQAANPQIKNINKILLNQKIKLPASPQNASTATTPAAKPKSAFPEMPDTTDKNGAEAFEIYAPYLRARGVDTDAIKPGERVILGLRRTTNVHANADQGRYDDRMVVVWRDTSGSGHAAEFDANTEPCGRYEDTPQHKKTSPKKIMGEDANKDGRQDLGCLPDGLYNYHKDFSAEKGGHILRPDHNIFVVRDINHDGVFDAVDDQQVLNKDRLDSALTILFHAGGTATTGSAGCQTFAPKEFAKFWAALGDQKHFEYVLTTVA
jgi:hypothetical protein